jgi:hypothetical protein
MWRNDEMVVMLWANENFRPRKTGHSGQQGLKMKKLKVMSVVGTRPEIIRLSLILAALDVHCEHVLVHTGQNYDYELNQVFFDDLGGAKARLFSEQRRW